MRLVDFIDLWVHLILRILVLTDLASSLGRCAAGEKRRSPTPKSDWIFWSLARLIDLTKSQQTKKLSICQLVVEIIALARS